MAALAPGDDGSGGGKKPGRRGGREAAPDFYKTKDAQRKAKSRANRSEAEKEVDRLTSKVRHQRKYLSRHLMDDDEWLFEQALAAAMKE